MRKKIPKTVGSIIVYDDEDNEWSMKWAIEQAYGRNIRGEEGLFYLNTAASSFIDENDNRVYYMSTVPGGYIESTDPDFYKYAYTYSQLKKICKNDTNKLDELLDLLIGQDPRVVYEEIRRNNSNRRKNNGRR